MRSGTVRAKFSSGQRGAPLCSQILPVAERRASQGEGRETCLKGQTGGELHKNLYLNWAKERSAEIAFIVKNSVIVLVKYKGQFTPEPRMVSLPTDQYTHVEVLMITVNKVISMKSV